MKIPQSSSARSSKQEIIKAGTRLGRFLIQRELGRGTVGVVYQAHDTLMDRLVAIKTYDPRLPLEAKRQRELHLINEARTASRLAHPGIVSFFEVSSEADHTFVVMELLGGVDLRKLLKSGKKFQYDEITVLAYKMADALAHMHKREVIHRDLKPANIFIEDVDTPKIVDFGIARSPNRISDSGISDRDPYTLTGRSGVLGTPYYMSPEQATGKPVDFRTDIYSLGAIIYELVVGVSPFKSSSKDTAEVLKQVAHVAPPDPHKLEPGMPLYLSSIIIKAMSKRPEKRYQSAEDMSIDLRRFLYRMRLEREQAELAAANKAQEDAAASAKNETVLSRTLAAASRVLKAK